MARVPLTIAALASAVMLSASPLASADQPVDLIEQPASAIPAQSANMLPLNLCGERDHVIAELAQVFNEVPMAVGQVDNNAVVEILVSDSGSWTILATGTDGTSCIVSAGEGFESTTVLPGVDA